MRPSVAQYSAHQQQTLKDQESPQFLGQRGAEFGAVMKGAGRVLEQANWCKATSNRLAFTSGWMAVP
jgi:hypothetical protein